MQFMHDEGSEFIGHNFQAMLDDHNIQHRPTTVKNPQANAICKGPHQTVTNALRPLPHARSPNNVDNAAMLVNTALGTAACLGCAAMHSTMTIPPGALFFQRNVMLNMPVIAGSQSLGEQHQALINKHLMMRADRCHTSDDCQPGQEMSIRAHDPGKLNLRATGPFFTVHSAHTNGAVTIQRNPCVPQRVIIRLLRPCHRAWVHEGFSLSKGSSKHCV
jgi:hypothetical protein